MSVKQMLDMVAVMKLLDVKRQAVMRLITSGKLAAYKVGPQWRFDPRDVNAYLASAKFVARAQATQPRSTHRRSGGQRSVERTAGAGRYM